MGSRCWKSMENRLKSMFFKKPWKINNNRPWSGVGHFGDKYHAGIMRETCVELFSWSPPGPRFSDFRIFCFSGFSGFWVSGVLHEILGGRVVGKVGSAWADGWANLSCEGVEPGNRSRIHHCFYKILCMRSWRSQRLERPEIVLKDCYFGTNVIPEAGISVNIFLVVKHFTRGLSSLSDRLPTLAQVSGEAPL